MRPLEIALVRVRTRASWPISSSKLRGLYLRARTRYGVLDSLDWVDTARHFTPAEEKSYTWWSYRNQDWKKSNRGRRLDHIWVTQPLKSALKSYSSHIDARDWEKPSDHIPVMMDLKIAG